MSENTLPQPITGSAVAAETHGGEVTLTRHGVEFHGTASEYFRIWIVNIALSILTLGIYSAWAKVRNKQYFYGSSFLDGASFEYTANPLNILKGRVLVFMVFVVYNLASAVQPILVVVLVAVILPLIPWVIISAVKFNHRHSSYRNIRFRFRARYWEGFKVYILWTLVIGLSFGLAYPFVIWRRKKMLVDRSSFGDGAFSYHAEVGFFFLVYILAGVIYSVTVLAMILLMTGGAAIFGGALIEGNGIELGEGQVELFGVLVAAVVYMSFLAAFIAFTSGVQAAISNHVWSTTRLGPLRFEYKQSIPHIVWIQLSNILAIVFSIGLLIPWAKVRITAYRLSCFKVMAPAGALAGFVAAGRESVSATGDEFGEAFDFDLGL